MAHASPSALITDKGRRVLIRIQGRHHELSHLELRALLDLPAGPPGLGITIDRDRLRFEFAGDNRTVEITAGRLSRRLTKLLNVKKVGLPNA
jgi:hypothetical protein